MFICRGQGGGGRIGVPARRSGGRPDGLSRPAMRRSVRRDHGDAWRLAV